MSKYISLLLLPLVLVVGVSSARAAESANALALWAFDDGRGSETVSDRSGHGLTGRIVNRHGGCAWGWDDFEGAFLLFGGREGDRVVVPHDAQLNLDAPFSIRVAFSCDLERIGKSNFAALLSKGEDYKASYSVLINRTGDVLVYLKGLTDMRGNRNRAYNLFRSAGIESGRDTVLIVNWDGAQLAIEVNGKKRGSLQRGGRLLPSEEPLYLGGIAHYPFAGTLKSVRIARLASSKGLPANATDDNILRRQKTILNPSAIIFRDFHALTPPILADRSGINHWYVSSSLFGAGFSSGPERLHKGPATEDLPMLTCRPKLPSGTYNLYVGMLPRVHMDNGIRLRTDTMENWVDIRLPPGMHPVLTENVLWATGIKMDEDSRLLVRGIPDRFTILQYFAFVPTRLEKKRAVDPARVVASTIPGPRDTVARRLTEGYLVERRHVEKASAPEGEQRGFTVFSPHWMELVFPDTQPKSDSGSCELRTVGARGETMLLALAVRPHEPLADFTIAPSGQWMRAKSAAPFPGTLSLCEVRSLAKRYGAYRGPGEFMRVPLYLEPARKRDLPANETVEYFIRITVAPDAPPGEYRTKLLLKRPGSGDVSVPVIVRVRPFALAPLRDVSLGFFTQLLPNPADPAPVRTMESYGLNAVAPFVFYRSGIQVTGPWDHPQVAFDQSSYRRAFRQFAEAGMDGPFFVHVAGFDFCNRLLPDEERYAVAYRAIASQIVREAESCGVLSSRLIFEVYDEVLSHPAALPKILRDLRILKAMGLHTSTTHLWRKTNKGKHQPMVDKIFPLLDSLVLRYSAKPIWYVDDWATILSEAKKLGKTVYHYNYTSGLAFPELESVRFTTGWFHRSLGADCAGSLLWNYDVPRLDPRDDLDGMNTDWIGVYPPAGADQGGPSLLLEAMGQGITDLRYAITLEDAIEKSRGKPEKAAAIQEAEELLHKLRNSLDMKLLREQCVYLESSWGRAWTDDEGIRFAAGRLTLPNGWTFEDYDTARESIARCLQALSQAL